MNVRMFYCLNCFKRLLCICLGGRFTHVQIKLTHTSCEHCPLGILGILSVRWGGACLIVLLGLTSMALLCLVTQATLQDSQVELETYRQTRQGLDEMYNVVWKQYNEEKRIRQVRNSSSLDSSWLGWQQIMKWLMADGRVCHVLKVIVCMCVLLGGWVFLDVFVLSCTDLLIYSF